MLTADCQQALDSCCGHAVTRNGNSTGTQPTRKLDECTHHETLGHASPLTAEADKLWAREWARDWSLTTEESYEMLVRFKFFRRETFLYHETIVMALYYCKELQPYLDCKLFLSQLLPFHRFPVGGPVSWKLTFQPWLRKEDVAIAVAGELGSFALLSLEPFFFCWACYSVLVVWAL